MKKLLLSFIILCSLSAFGQTVDVLDYFCPSNRTTNHLDGTGVHTYCWLDNDGIKIWLIKNSAGHPWDIHIYDNDWVYWWITENGDIPGGFNNDSAWKRKQIPIPLAPRHYTFGTTVTAPATKGPSGASNVGVRTSNCETESPPDFRPLGDTLGVTTSATMAWGGDIGTLPTIIINYYYSGHNDSYNSRERYFLTSKGWVQWDVASCAGTCTPGVSTYTVSQTSTKTTVAAGGAPTPTWPCGTNYSWWYGGAVGAGGNAAQVNTPDHTEDVTFTAGLIYDTGASGFTIGHGMLNNTNPPDWDTTVPQQITIQDNEISHTGLYDPTGIGSSVWIGNAHHVTVDHNTIHYSPGGGIESGFILAQDNHGQSFTHHNWYTNNQIYDIMLGITDDDAGIYSASNYSNNCPDRILGSAPVIGGAPYTEATGNTYCNHSVGNIIHDIALDTTTGDGYNAQCVYNDQGTASHDFRQNICYRISDACVFNNLSDRGNDIYPQYNLFQWNVFASCGSSSAQIHVGIKRGGENPNSFTAEGNVWNTSQSATQQQKPGQWGCFDNNGGVVGCTSRFNFSHNIYERCNTLSTPPNCNLVPAFTNCTVFGNCTGPNMSSLTFAQWQAAPISEDPGACIASGGLCHPVFRDPHNGDFTPTANLSSFGIPAFDLSTAGRRVTTLTTPSVPDMFQPTPLAQSAYDSY